jgi:hypothetical protein
MKKELDLAQVLRDSILKANKDLGFLKEVKVEESAFDEEFDRTQHMPSFKLAPKKWGIKGTRESRQLDAAINNIVPTGETDGLKRFKLALTNLNNALGTTTSDTGKENYTTYEETGKSTLNQIISGLMIKNVMSSLITDLPAGAAGESFEGFVSRLAGGYTPNEGDKPIQDLVDSEGNFISLKTIIAATEIQGSMPNLARGIVTAPGKKVIYLVCVKDRESDPFKMRTFSFEINESNFFKFITKKNNPSVKDVQDIQSKIFGELSVPELEEFLTEAEVAKDAESFAKKDLKLIFKKDSPETDQVIQKYFENLGKKESSPQAFKAEAQKAIDSTTQLSDTEVALFNLAISRKEEAAETFNLTPDSFKKELLEKMFSGEGKIKTAGFVAVLNVFPSMQELMTSDIELKAILASDAYKKFEEEFKSATELESKKEEIENKFRVIYLKKYLADKNISDDNSNTVEGFRKLYKANKLDKEFEKQIAIADKASAAEKEKAERQFRQSGGEGKLEDLKRLFSEEMDSIRKKLGTLVNFTAQVNKAVMETQGKERTETSFERERRGRTETEISPEEKQNSEKLQKAFFDRLSSFYSGQQESLQEAKDSVSGQFSMSQNMVKEFAVNYSADYPQVVVQKRRLFDSAQENAKQFEEWAEPIYRGMHYLTQGINQYFLEDKPSGLKKAEDRGVKEVQTGIAKFEGKPASELGQEKATQQTESKKTAFNDDFLDDILKDLI